jgi:peptidoglycan/LPS O-acetylase OafA/YrhL
MMISIALPFALILLGCVLAERRYGWKPPRLLLNLGDATYAIYLVHSPAITMIALLNYKLALGVMPPMVLFAVTCIGSVAAGMLAHLFVERPVLGFLKNLETRGIGSKVASFGKSLGATAVHSIRILSLAASQSRYAPVRWRHAGLANARISRTDVVRSA